MGERLITADDLIAGGCCYDGVMQHASRLMETAIPLAKVLRIAGDTKELGRVRRALALDGYGNGYSYGYGCDGDGDGCDGYGYGDGYGGGDGYGYSYGYGCDGDGDGHSYGG